MTIKQKTEEFCIEHFGKKIEDMNAEQTMLAISFIAAKLIDETSEEEYKRIEKVTMSVLKGKDCCRCNIE